MVESKNYEKEINRLKINAELQAKEFEGDLKVSSQMSYGYYSTVAEIMKETAKKLDEAIQDSNQGWD